MRTLRRLVRALSALAVLVAALAGLPVALAEWGRWPISGIPSWEQVTNLPSTILTDSSLFGILTVAAWLVWAAFVASVSVELVASIRGEPGVSLPLCAPLQSWARPLVASLVMSVSATGQLAASPVGLLNTRPAAAIELVADPAEAPASFPAPNAPTATPDQPSRTGEPDGASVVVLPDDTYWGIAERTLGDGLRWREIRDRNVGRTMADGRVVEADSDLLMPGWILILPDGPFPSLEPSTNPDTVPADTAAPVESEVTVQPGDSMWRLAETHLGAVLGRSPTPAETAAYCARLVDANRGRLADPSNPDVIYSGQVFVLPVASADAPTAVPPDARPVDPPEVETPIDSRPTSPPTTSPPRPSVPTTVESIPSPTEPTRQGPSPAADEPGDTGRDNGGNEVAVPVAAVAGLVGTALAVGLTRALRRRRQQRNHHSPNRTPLPPPHEALHRQLVAAADEESIDVLARALVDLATHLRNSAEGARPRIVQHGAEHLDVVLDRPIEPALGSWQAIGNGSIWTLDAKSESLPDASRRWTSPAPLLVPIGAADADGQIYLDLETAAVTTLTGDRDVALDLLRTIAIEAAHSPLGNATQVVIVGDIVPTSLFDETELVTVVDGWDGVVGDLARRVEQSRSALAIGGHRDPFTARAIEPTDDSLLPLLVISCLAPEAPERLAFLHTGPAAAAVVVLNDAALPGSTIVECSAGELHLPQLGISCVPQALHEGQATELTDLLRAASDLAGPQLSMSLDLGHGGNGAAPESERPPYEDPKYEVLVRLLGDITIEGRLRRRLTGKELAAVSYVALNRSVTVDRVEDALWANPTASNTRRARLFHIMSQCRSALGDDLLPTADDGYYTVGPELRTDLELFEARVAAAKAEPQRSVAADLLLKALELCTGQVFHYQSRDGDSFSWIDAANLVSHWELKVTSLAQDLAERWIEADDVPRAMQAAEAGLRVLPTHTGCTESLMRAHAATGNRDGYRRVYQAHAAALELIHLDQVAESTARLYEQLQSAG